MSLRIPTNLRILLILEVISKADRALSPTQINETLGLPKQSIYRLIASLVAQGFLIGAQDKNHYRPTRRLRMLGAGVLFASRSNIMRHQILQQVARDLKEAVNFVIPEESGMKYLDRVETDWPFRVQLPRGSHVPFHTTASGKCFIASLSVRARKKFVSALELSAYTRQTHICCDTLLAELKETALRGFSIDNEEFIEGMTAVAVPVYDLQGRFVAALASHGPKDRLKIAQNAAKIAQTLTHHAKRLQGVIFA